MILQTRDHLINLDKTTHIGPGTGGNKSTFHFEGGGIAVTDLTHAEIAALVSEATGNVTQHIDDYRAAQEEEEPVDDGTDDGTSEEEPIE